MSRVTEKISDLEKALEKLVILHQKTQEKISKLSEEMREFKEWSKQNIAEIRRESKEFKKEMEEFKEWSKKNIAEIKKSSEEFKEEMEEFKEWSKQNIAEIRENHEKFAKEIGEFKEWSKMNIAEIRKESEKFHREMEEFKEWSKKNIAEIRESSEEFKEWSKQNIAEIRKSSEEFKEEMEEFKEWSKKNIAEIRESSEEFKEWSKQNIAEIRKSSEEFKEWVKQSIKDLNKKWGELANRLGTVVEDIIAPGLIEASQKYFGCGDEPDDFMVRRRKRNTKDRSKVKEFDLIIVCGDNVIVNETKTTPKPEDVETFYNFIKNGRFFDYFPEFKGKNIIPVFSSLNMPQDIINLLTKKGIYAATMKGDYIDLVNFSKLNLI